MEGIYFYWFFWIAWIYTTFLLEKTQKRVSISLVLLLFIIFSDKHINVNDLLVNTTTLLCLLVGYLLVSRKKMGTLFYYLSVSLILTSSYVTFRLFQLYDPVWVMFHPTMKLALILLILIIILIREQSIRIGLLFIGVAQGEIVYTLFLNKIVPQPVLGQLESLDIIAITAGISFLWFGFEKMVAILDDYVKQRTILSSSKK
ncbi:YphA family membrane protein [Anaerobacillus isosaccharinicus]|uniref:Uncharacterized protein n=1 Tax=Anaerobacillus isosaccharinicus TaxID=1532552 RepID=A0A1S2KVS4_9BACI|nr:hypothetical protein [Anaerobacillus isosaccharinicus]MBA5585839.1 hypothetical protein [Anaerobacillus isosaccharinicus]QOY35866.1 hypothetical protein AWH56_024975 [Anaerobacillus isosaccharinicus]